MKANDEAIAGELIFCLWVRRRDPHAWNRAYIDGVPMFFDHHVAFDGRALVDFFELGDDGSHPPRWRVRTFDNPDEVPTTRGERDVARPIALEVGLHRVKSLSTFDAGLDTAAEHIEEMDGAWIAEQVEFSGAPRAVYDLLERSRAELPTAMKRLRATLFA
jgi:hypothetical protein